MVSLCQVSFAGIGGWTVGWLTPELRGARRGRSGARRRRCGSRGGRCGPPRAAPAGRGPSRGDARVRGRDPSGRVQPRVPGGSLELRCPAACHCDLRSPLHVVRADRCHSARIRAALSETPRRRHCLDPGRGNRSGPPRRLDGSVVVTKLTAFAASAFVAGIAGGLLALQIGGGCQHDSSSRSTRW